MSKPHDTEYRKFVDDSVVNRELEDAIGRFKLAVFIAALGPIILGMAKVLQATTLPRELILALYATGPAGVAVFLVQWIRAPRHARKHPKTWYHLLYTLAAGAATFVLVQVLKFD